MNVLKEDELTEELQVRLDLKGDSKEMFVYLKKHYNLAFNAELVRFLIKREYDRCKEK